MTNQPPTWCTCTTGGINPTCSHHAWQLPRNLAPPRMDALIAEARTKPPAIFHHGYFPDVADDLIPRLASALEASQAQVAELKAALDVYKKRRLLEGAK